ncbi:MAG: 23S rRNA (adenine(2030)-N(6))-methyltransferase RlmJ [Roseinatronobacter sp.]
MLSYQHLYHAGNLADVHKHALLAWVLDYMTAKDKPLSYLETHAGRGLYDLEALESAKTGEAAMGIARLQARFAPDHPYARVIAQVRAQHGPSFYPGSPLIAAGLLRGQDKITLAELHPREFAALSETMAGSGAQVLRQDGLAVARAWAPPTPRRGVLMIDPSYEVKEDYATLPPVLALIRRKWNVGVVILWYPVLLSGVQEGMLAQIRADHPDVAVFETRFPPIRDGHRMVGTGLVVLNAPYGMALEAERVAKLMTR